MSEFCGFFAKPEYPADRAKRHLEEMLSAFGQSHVGVRQETPATGLYLGFAIHDAFAHEVPYRGQMSSKDNLIVFGDISIWQRDPDVSPLQADDVSYLHAHLRHGQDLSSVNGYFSGGSLDLGTGVLTLFRDQIGMRTIYYVVQDHGLFFASNLRFFYGGFASSETLDLTSLAAFAVMQHPGVGHTYFKGISELSAANVLEVRPDKPPVERRYWSLETTDDHGLRNPDDAIAHVREKLELAVKGQLNGARNPAVSLSGGLDSTTIASLVGRFWDREPLLSVTHHAPIPDEPVTEVNDWHYIDDVIQFVPGFVNFPAASDHIDVLAGAEHYFQTALVPNRDLFFNGSKATLDIALEHKADVFLDGMFGDYAFSTTEEPIMYQALLRGDFSTFRQEYQRRLRNNGGRLFSMVLNGLIKPIASARLTNFYRKVAKTHWSQTTMLHRDWINSAELRERINKSGHYGISSASRSVAASIADQIQDPLIAQMSTHADYISGDKGLRARSPLADVGLLQALYWTPYQAFSSAEINRSIAKRVAKDLLPPSVLQRDTKDDFSPSHALRLLERLPHIESVITDPGSGYSDLYDRERLLSSISAIRSRNYFENAETFETVLLPYAATRFLEFIRN